MTDQTIAPAVATVFQRAALAHLHKTIRELERPREVHGPHEASLVLSEMHKALGMRLALDILGLPNPEGDKP